MINKNIRQCMAIFGFDSVETKKKKIDKFLTIKKIAAIMWYKSFTN